MDKLNRIDAPSNISATAANEIRWPMQRQPSSQRQECNGTLHAHRPGESQLQPSDAARRSTASASKPLQFLITDDHTLIRKGLIQILDDAYPGSKFTEAANGESALTLVRDGHFDAVVLDVSLAKDDGFDVLVGIKRHRPQLPVVMFSMHAEPQIALRAFRLGASGYVTKASEPTTVTTALEHALAGQMYTSPDVGPRLALVQSTAPDQFPHETLSRRELQVFKLVGQAQTARQIAESLGVSEKTIGTYRARISSKTGLKTYAEIVKYALTYKL